MPTLDSTLLAQYQSVRETVGLLDYSSRGKIRVSGPDHVSFLHSMISNDVRELEEWRGRYATFLTPRGKMVCDFYFYKLPDFVLIDLDSSLLSRMMETLGKFIIMDDVSLEDASQDWGHLSLQGPRSGELIRRLVEIETPHEDLQVVALSWRGQSGWLVRRNELGPMGFEIILPRTSMGSFQQAVAEGGDRVGLGEVGPEAHNILRLEQGIPWYGVDMDESHYPMEARLDRAISLDKGCYVGQEVVAKATHIGGVGRLLTKLSLDGTRVPEVGAGVLTDDGKPIGKVTSAVFSPSLERPIGLAYLKKAWSKPGQRCSVEAPPGRPLVAEVVQSFLLN